MAGMALSFDLNAFIEDNKKEVDKYVDKASKYLDDVQDYIEDDLKPDLDHYLSKTADLGQTLKEQDWKSVKDWDSFKDIDWKSIKNDLKVIDKEDLIDWKQVKQDANKIAKHIDQRQEKLSDLNDDVVETKEKVEKDINWDMVKDNIQKI